MSCRFAGARIERKEQQQVASTFALAIDMTTLVAQSALEQVVCAVAFGAASPLVGHPVDSVKTRMQSDARYAASSALQTARGVLRAEGLRGLYRGLLFPLVGSSFFRSTQFGVFGASMSAMRHSPLLSRELPFSGGLSRSPRAGQSPWCRRRRS